MGLTIIVEEVLNKIVNGRSDKSMHVHQTRVVIVGDHRVFGVPGYEHYLV